MIPERTGEGPRRRRGGRRPDGRTLETGQRPAPLPGGQSPPRGGFPGGGPSRGAPSIPLRPGNGPPRGNSGPQGGIARGPRRPPSLPNSRDVQPRSSGQRPQGWSRQRSTNGAAGWTSVRPWQPPRDDANEPILDDDEPQPDYVDRRLQGVPRPSTGNGAPPTGFNGRGHVRPPSWPSGNVGRPPPRPPERRPPPQDRRPGPPAQGNYGPPGRGNSGPPGRGTFGPAAERGPRRPRTWLPQDLPVDDT